MWKLSKEEFDSYFGDKVATPYKFVNNAYGYVNHDVLLYKEEHENYTVYFQCIGRDGKPIDSKIYFVTRDKYVKLFIGVSDNKVKIPIENLLLFSSNIFREIEEESVKQLEQKAKELMNAPIQLINRNRISPNEDNKLILEIATKLACSYVRNENTSNIPNKIALDSVQLAKELIKQSYE